MRTYKGYDIYRHDENSMGMRWYTYSRKGGKLRSDTLAGLKQLINAELFAEASEAALIGFIDWANYMKG